MPLEVLHLFDEGNDVFRAADVAFDVVCAGDSLTGWGNFGPPGSWPFRCYPEILQALCEPLGIKVANCGVAGEISANGVWQVRDYLKLFHEADFFVLGFGANDLDGSTDLEETTRRVVEHLGKMVESVREQRKHPVLLNVPDVNSRLYPAAGLDEARRKRRHFNGRLAEFCSTRAVPLADISARLRQESLADQCHPNAEGARTIAQVVLDALAAIDRRFKAR